MKCVRTLCGRLRDPHSFCQIPYPRISKGACVFSFVHLWGSLSWVPFFNEWTQEIRVSVEIEINDQCDAEELAKGHGVGKGVNDKPDRPRDWKEAARAQVTGQIRVWIQENVNSRNLATPWRAQDKYAEQ